MIHDKYLVKFTFLSCPRDGRVSFMRKSCRGTIITLRAKVSLTRNEENPALVLSNVHRRTSAPDGLSPWIPPPSCEPHSFCLLERCHNREAEFCSVAGRVTTYPLISLKSLEKAVIWNLLGHNLIFEKESAYIGGEKEALLDMEMNLKTVTNKAKSESEKEQEWSSEKRKGNYNLRLPYKNRGGMHSPKV